MSSPRTWPWRAVVPLAVLIVAVQVAAAYLTLGRSPTPSATGLLLENGYPVGGDFILYYSTAKLALRESAAAVYDVARLHAVQQEVLGAPIERQWAWFYPPALLGLVLPLGWLSFLGALAVWTALGLALYLAVAYRALPHRLTMIAVLLFPAGGDALFSGQNGCLNLALLGGGLLLLERRPVLAGVLFGLLTYKPHLGVLLPFALVAGREWRAITAAVVSALAIHGASLVAFGPEAWSAFLAQAPLAGRAVEEGLAPWYNMPTPFVAARMLGLGIDAAWLLQAVATATLAGAVAWLWRRPAGFTLRAAGLMFAVPLATPYAQFYDLAILALPILWLFDAARRGGRLAAEMPLLAALWLAPVAAPLVAQHTPLQLWPLVLGTALVVVVRRAAVASA